MEVERNTSKHPVTPGDVLPAIELLGDMYFEMEKYHQAFAAYEEDLKGRPHRFNGVYGAAISAKLVGNIKAAEQYFKELIEMVTIENSTRPEIVEATAYLKMTAIKI